jgi:hypothetical protein
LVVVSPESTAHHYFWLFTCFRPWSTRRERVREVEGVKRMSGSGSR